ncbi:DUF6233 domain-containing protein [Streptomyces cyaneofuscatus]|uniref:DUF6233 domain-containing protein n=1 Tax=Streptomyces cyaneofuscatus TaxID=66883 RepID=UPI0033A21F29
MSTDLPPPPVEVVLPDGQAVRGRLHERRQTEDGWLYRVGVVLWQAPDPDHPEPGEYVAWMPSAAVRPLTGADYALVPTTRLRRDIPAPPVRRVEPATAWRVEYERHRADREVQRSTVHRADCWSIRGRYEEITDEREARAAMARTSARGCILCGTDQSLAA